jgi:glutaconyl-CoA/methylmalonyl-CoA decarboxylase subunit delta
MNILLNIWELGLTLTLIGYMVVLAALAILYGFYTLVPLVLDYYNKFKLKKQGKNECVEKSCEEISGETAAAIATALYHFFNELHDEESGKITIKRVSRNYSPWSSKIYGVNRRL